MQGEPTVSGWSFPTRPVILLASFTFANNFIRHFLENELKGTVLLGVILAALFVLILLAVKSDGIRLNALYSLSLPLIVAASLCVLFPLSGFGTAGAMMSNAAYTLFSIYVTALLCSISYRFGVDALWLFGFANGSVSLGSLLSTLLSNHFDIVEDNSIMLTAMVSIVILAFVILYAAFSGSKDLASSWGIEPIGRKDEQQTEALEMLEDKCGRISRRFGLTRREEEVLLLLAQGDTFSRVEEKLSISNSTLKTHSRHLYAKIGVSGKTDLERFVKEYR